MTNRRMMTWYLAGVILAFGCGDSTAEDVTEHPQPAAQPMRLAQAPVAA